MNGVKNYVNIFLGNFLIYKGDSRMKTGISMLCKLMAVCLILVFPLALSGCTYEYVPVEYNVVQSAPADDNVQAPAPVAAVSEDEVTKTEVSADSLSEDSISSDAISEESVSSDTVSGDAAAETVSEAAISDNAGTKKDKEKKKPAGDGFIEEASDGMKILVNGKEQGVLTFAEEKNENGDYEHFTVSFNSGTLKEETHYFDMDKYIVHKGDKLFLLTDRISESDFHELDIYALSENSVTHINSMDAAVCTRKTETDPDELTLLIRSDLLSTYFLEWKYAITEEGEFEPLEPFGYLPEEAEFTLKLKLPIKARFLDEETGLSFHEVTVGGGMELKLYRSDAEKYVDAIIPDGESVVRIMVDTSEYPQKIGEESIEDLFFETFFAS